MAPSTVLMMGRHGSAKRTIATNFIGKPREELVTRERWVSQMKGEKDGICLMGMPEEHGRMSAYRQRVAAVNKADAFMVVLRNDNPQHYEYTRQMVQDIKGADAKISPWTIVAGYITNEVPVVNPKVAEWAESIGAKVHLVNVAKVKKNDAEESKKLASIIREVLAEAAKPQAPAEPTETAETTETPNVDVPATPTAQQQQQQQQKRKEEENTKKPEPKRSAVNRAISYLVNGGSVA